MKRLILVGLLMSSAAWAAPKKSLEVSGRNDPCAPIGRTEDGKLVYSLKCETLPAPPARTESSAAPVEPAPAEPQTTKSGLFGWSFERKPANGEAAPANRPDAR